MKSCPIRLRPPWGKNYCHAWLIYHGGFVAVGLLLMLFHIAEIFPGIGLGSAIVIGGLIAGCANYLLDTMAQTWRE